LHMLNDLRTALARLIVRHLRHPRSRVIRAWLWLAADSLDVTEKRCCLNAVLQLDPENEPASMALLVLDQIRPES